MKELLYTLPLLACPVGMGLMMWFMMRGKKEEAQPPRTNAEMSASGTGTDVEIARLRAELDPLRAVQRDRDTPADRTPGTASSARE